MYDVNARRARYLLRVKRFRDSAIESAIRDLLARQSNGMISPNARSGDFVTSLGQ